MTAPGDFSSGDVLTAADMNALPAGVVAIQRLGGSPSTTINLSTTNQNILSGSDFDMVAGRRYGFFLQLTQLQNASTSLTMRARLEGPTTRVAVALQAMSTGLTYTHSAFGVYDATTTASNQSYHVDIDTSTGTCDLFTADQVQESIFMIVDLGEY